MRKAICSLLILLWLFTTEAQQVSLEIQKAATLLEQNHWQQAFDAFEAILNLEQPRMTYLQQAKVHNYLGFLHLMFLDPQEAERELSESLVYHEKAGIPDEKSYADALINAGLIYLEQVEFDLARQNVKQALRILEKKQEWNVDYLIARSKLARIYEEAGSYTLALSIYEECYNGLLAMGIELSPDFADICSHRGRIFMLTGDILEGEKFISLSSTIYESLGPSYDVQRAETLEDLALFYEKLGKYNEAESLLLEILDIKKSIPDEAAILIIETLNDLGILYQQINEYDKAEAMFKEVVSSSDEHVGIWHPFYAIAKNNLGSIALTKGKNREAQKLLLDALEKFENRFGPSHPYAADVLNNLARTERRLGNPSQAEQYYKRVLQIDAVLYGEDHPNYATTLLNIGILLSSNGREAQAEPYYLKVLEIREKSLGPDHPAYGSALDYTGMHFLAAKNLSAAEEQFRKSILIQLNQIQALFPIMTQSQREQFFLQIREDVKRYHSIASSLLDTRPELIKQIFDFQAQTKSIPLHSYEKMEKNVLSSRNEALVSAFEKWKTEKQLLAGYYQMGVDQLSDFHVNIYQVEADIAAQEKYLAENIELFEEALPYQKLTWSAVLNRVKENEALVELIKINEYTALDDQKSSFYGFSEQCKYLAIIFNGKAKSINHTYLGTTDLIPGNQALACTRGSVLNLKGEGIYRAFWKPLVDKTKHAKQLLVVPDGLYYDLNPNGFKINKNEFVFDTQYVSYLSSTHDLFRATPKTQEKKLCVFSNPQFTHTAWQDLAGFNKNSTEDLSNNTASWSLKQYQKANANEYHLRSLYHPTILHLNLPVFLDSEENFISAKIPEQTSLYRSGLFFVGIADSYEKYTRNIPSIPENDGVLSVYEVLNLELERTRLVILSTVSSNLKHIDHGQSLHALVRAFCVAGARAVVTTLRSIDENKMTVFTKKFYAALFRGEDTFTAFRSAQSSLKNQFKEDNSWSALMFTGIGH
ncbi:MAG: tetratricopeptide repeat protein [Bacteroidota bacterium]